MLLVVQADSPRCSAQRPRRRSVSLRACRCPVGALRVAQSHLHWRVVCGVSCLLCAVLRRVVSYFMARWSPVLSGLQHACMSP